MNHSPYIELAVTTCFTFLTGASQPAEMVEQAAALGYRAMAMCDHNTLAGIVRGYVAAKEAGIEFIVGCRLVVQQPAGLSLCVYPTDLASYGRLCRLLTRGKQRAEKGECHLTLHDVLEHQQGLIAIVMLPKVIDEELIGVVRELGRVFDDDRLSIAISRDFAADEAVRWMQLEELSAMTRVPLVAINDVHYHVSGRRRLQDIVTCIKHGCTIEEAGYLLHPHGERYLKEPAVMERLFDALPQAIARTALIAERCRGFSLDQLKYNYPQEVVPEGVTPMQHLRTLTMEGARERYASSRGGVPSHVLQQLEHELKLIEELDYPRYFLTVHDLVRFAREQKILCQGRGAAANSAVCFCLGVTAVDPIRGTMLFERFVSKERDEPPDIDIDFEHERREEVIQYLYRKYGRDRAALTAEIISYRSRSALRDVGKAMGLSLDVIEKLSKECDWWSSLPKEPEKLSQWGAACGVNVHDPLVVAVLHHAREIMGFPRHLSQHVGGFVITQTPLCELVPIENAAMEDRTVIEWDKDDIEALDMLKVDVLGLGMLTCVRKCLDLIASSDGQRYELATIPAEDPATYAMIQKADTVGVFQIESRAQMQMLPRLKPRCFYDLVIEVAIVRPGPIQGNMVHPYIRRRNGEEPVVFASPEIERVLGRTLGVPLFQEQCMSLAISAAGFTPGEADQLRRAMAAWKRSGKAILKFEEKLITGMTSRGYSLEFARQVFSQISGFSGYGFPESHAASFAILVYASCWLKCHHPAAYAAALINSQPMGFYQPSQIVRDAQQHGVVVREADVNHSGWDCRLERDEKSRGGWAIRLGMRLVKGLGEEAGRAVERVVSLWRERSSGGFASMEELVRQVRRWNRGASHDAQIPMEALRNLARADGFGSMGLHRQGALWALQRLDDARMPLFEELLDRAQEDEDIEALGRLPRFDRASEVAMDYARGQLSLKAHPVRFVREQLASRGVRVCADLADEKRWPHGKPVAVAGLVTVRQRPSTASGIVFITIEDETGVANLVVMPAVFEKYRKAARHGVAVVCYGKVERKGPVVHVKAMRIERLDLGAGCVGDVARSFH